MSSGGLGSHGLSPKARIILRLERRNTLAQRFFLSPLLILGEGEGEVYTPRPLIHVSPSANGFRKKSAQNYSRFEVRSIDADRLTPRQSTEFLTLLNWMS